jgi:hypothetical protein
VKVLGRQWGIQGLCHGRPQSKPAVVLFANSQNALNIAKPIIDAAMSTDSLAFAWLKERGCT